MYSIIKYGVYLVFIIHIVLTLAIFGMFLEDINVYQSTLDDLFADSVGWSAMLSFYMPLMMVFPLLHLS